MIYFISQNKQKFELSGNYAEFLSNTQVTHNLIHLPHPLKAQKLPHCLARPGAGLLNTTEMHLLCAHMPEGTGPSIPSQLGRAGGRDFVCVCVHLNCFVDLNNTNAWI